VRAKQERRGAGTGQQTSGGLTMQVMAGRVTTMGAVSMGRVRVRCGSVDRGATDRAPPCQKAQCAVVDHLQSRKRWAGANEAPRGPGSTAAPPLKGTVGGGAPPASPNAPRTSQEATRDRRPPPPPPPPHTAGPAAGGGGGGGGARRPRVASWLVRGAFGEAGGPPPPIVPFSGGAAGPRGV